MVVFECQQCNETVKKPKLAKHLEVCGSYYVTCIDCSKTFAWDAWESHTSCVSEAQKYQGNLFQAKESNNKGQAKQDSWIDNVEKKIGEPGSGISPQTQALLQKLLGFNNIPRKQKPFANFVKNSLKIWNDKQIGEMWSVIQAANAPAPAPKAAGAPPPAPAPAAAGPSDSKGAAEGEAKRKATEEGAQGAGKCPRAGGWVSWRHALEEELRAAGGVMPWESLRDAAVARFRECGQADGAADDDLGYLALTNIPDGYLSREDEFVRLAANT